MWRSHGYATRGAVSDIFSKRKRSALMALIRSRGNKATELRLSAIFRARGIAGWRRQQMIRGQRSEVREQETGDRGRAAARSHPRQAEFRVRPDFVFPKQKLAVFVDGCFWHACPIHATQPKQNAKFWREKLARNRARDRLVTRTLRARGWRVMRIWEHELTRKNEQRLLRRLARFW